MAPSTSYCFYVSSSYGGEELSSSNRACVATGSETIPGWAGTDAVSVTTQGLMVYGSYDEEGSMDSFVIQKFERLSSEWVTVVSGTGTDGIFATVIPGADTAGVNLYRTALINNCGIVAVTAPPARNIVLQSVVRGTLIDLRWNNPFPSDDAVYSVWRETGNGWEEIVSQVTDTLLSEDYSLFARTVSSSRVAYHITALREGAPLGAPVSRSNTVLAELAENIYMPNAFTPDDDGLNDIFMPVLSFMPLSYEMRIYSRSGVLLFRTVDYATGWDGRHSGNRMASGVYLWSIIITTPSGRTETRRGTVTIMP